MEIKQTQIPTPNEMFSKEQIEKDAKGILAGGIMGATGTTALCYVLGKDEFKSAKTAVKEAKTALQGAVGESAKTAAQEALTKAKGVLKNFNIKALKAGKSVGLIAAGYIAGLIVLGKMVNGIIYSKSSKDNE